MTSLLGSNRRFVLSRHGFLLLAAMLAISSLAEAQNTLSSPPPIYSAVDPQNVDVGTGSFTAQGEQISIGQANMGGLTFSRTFIGNGWVHSLDGKITQSGTAFIVSLGAASESFTTSNGGVSFTNNGGGGSTLSRSGSLYTYTLADGGVATFSLQYCCQDAVGILDPQDIGGGVLIARITSLTLPAGEIRTWNYRQVVVGGMDPSTYIRLQSVSNNFGYQIRLVYAFNDNGSDPGISNITAWLTANQVVAFNMATDACDPAAASCSFSQTWPNLSYAVPSDNANARTVTDALNRVTRYTYDGNSHLIGIRRPSSPSADNLTIGYNSASGRVATVNNGAGTWSYSYSDSGNTRTTTMTDPLGHQRVSGTTISTGQLVSDQDALSHTASYLYDSFNRLQQVTFPEGDVIVYNYDGRGNIITQTRQGKPGSGLQISSTATYETSCSSANLKYCNKLESLTDENGHGTRFTYDASHGGVLTATHDAPASGLAQPQTRYSYATFQAAYKSGNGSLTSGSSVYLITGSSTCLTGSSCSGTSAEATTSIGYGVSGQANNLLPVSVTRGAGDASVSSALSFTYYATGDLATKTGPDAGMSDRHLYDAARQHVGLIGADPDGSGPLNNRAIRYTYNPDGQLKLVEQGVTIDQTDGGWAGFTTLLSRSLTYDAQARLIQNNGIDHSGATQTVTQYGYDAANRQTCVAQRMNNATFGALPAVCSAATPGAQGPDRIKQYGFDAANRMTSITSALGTAQQITVATTYSPDGMRLSVTDGNSNMTSYAYDGFNRLSKTSYPLPSTSNASSSTDFETYGYDNVGNRTSQRQRDGSTVSLQYDTLDRLATRQVQNLSTSDNTVYQYAYDNVGYVTQVQGVGQTLAFTYDALGRRLSETGPLGAVSWQYDPAGRITRLTWPGPSPFYVQYNYDTTGAMTSALQNGATTLFSYAYDNLGRRVSITRANGVTSSLSYDAFERLAGLAHNLAGTANDVSFSYTYNAAGQIASRTSSNSAYAAVVPQVVNSTFNGLNEMTALTLPTGNNPWTWTASGAFGSASTQYDGDNHMTALAGTTFAYDAAARLYLTNKSGAITRFLYADDQIIAEYDNSGSTTPLRRYVPGAMTDEHPVWYEGGDTSSPRWLVADERGSVIAVTDNGGSALAINVYEYFGGAININNTGRFQYTGQAWIPEGHLYYYKTRMYVPTNQGIFYQPDPSGYRSGLNLYAYAGGDPINMTDPSGMDCGNQDQTEVTICTSPFFDGFGGNGPTGSKTGGNGGSNPTNPTQPVQNSQPTPEVIITDKKVAQEEFIPPIPELFEPLGRVMPPDPVPYPKDPTVPPGPGWIWKGQPDSIPGDKQGNWYNPATGESLRPDLQHPPGIDPHWDYKAPDGNWYRWFGPDNMSPKAALFGLT